MLFSDCPFITLLFTLCLTSLWYIGTLVLIEMTMQLISLCSRPFEKTINQLVLKTIWRQDNRSPVYKCMM